MPIKIPDNLPARESLLSEAVDVINSSYAERQDIRPLKFLLLNLMPKKVPTEIQFARLIGASPLQIELTLMTTKSYQPKNTNQDYLIQFYKTLDDIRHDFFDVFLFHGVSLNGSSGGPQRRFSAPCSRPQSADPLPAGTLLRRFVATRAYCRAV